MNAAQQELWSRIKSFDFTPADATFSFADRLKKETGWSAQFAARAIEEYRRFAFLAATAGHPVSPSEVIDEVWHLHLIYTRSYWDNFCDGILKMRLHHEPSTGGHAERAKFGDWYDRTRASYRDAFGLEPPVEFWPGPEAKPAGPIWTRVDARRNWIVQKPVVAGGITVAAVAVLLMAVAVGCERATVSAPPRQWAQTLNPFDFTGPQFLFCFAIAWGVAVTVGWMVRSAARRPDELPLRPLSMNPYEAAFLNGGAPLAVNAALATLASRDVIEISPALRTVERNLLMRLPADVAPIESAVYACIPAGGGTIREVQDAGKAATRKLDANLQAAGLVVQNRVDAGARTSSVIVGLAPAAIGIVKVMVGVSRNRPVGYLVGAVIVTTLATLLMFARPLHRTRRGDRLLAKLKIANSPLRKGAPDLIGDPLCMAIGLYGLPVLALTPFSKLQTALAPPPPASNTSGWSGGDSGCGTSGCGGGGGGGGCGGGGGGGGGGCGGCGGGGH